MAKYGIGGEPGAQERVAALRRSVRRPKTGAEMAEAIVDIAQIDLIAGEGSRERTSTGFTLVFHGRDGRGEKDYLWGAHLSSPAFLFQYRTENSMGSGSPFSYAHYHDGTLGPAIFAAAAGVRGCPKPEALEMYAQAFLILRERGMLLIGKNEYEDKNWENIRAAAEGKETMMFVSLAFDPNFIRGRPLGFEGTKACLETAFRDETGTVFLENTKKKLAAWIESSVLSEEAAFSSKSRERRGP